MSLDITDTRTGRKYSIDIQDNFIQGQDLAKIQNGSADSLKVYDPGFSNTAIMHSSVAHGNGKASRLEYRGRDVYDLVENHDFEEVAFLLIWNRLPSPSEKTEFRARLSQKALEVPDHVEDVVRSYPKTAPHMTIMIGALSAALSGKSSMIPAVSGNGVNFRDLNAADDCIIDVIATYAVCLGLAYSHKSGGKFEKAELDANHIQNVFAMMGFGHLETGKVDPKLLSIMQRWWIVSADHELAHSTCATLLAASAYADPISCVISGITSGYGTLHLGATQSSYVQQQEIGKPENVAKVIAECKAGKRRLMGCGHRVYKSKNDPRLVIVKQLLHELKDMGYWDPLVEVSFEIEKQVNADPFFARKSLYINYDNYWWALYTSLGIDINAVVPCFFAQRVFGLMAHWRELMTQSTKLWRPNMLYTPPATRPSSPDADKVVDEQRSSAEFRLKEDVIGKSLLATVTQRAAQTA